LESEIKNAKSKKLVGMRLIMSFADNKTGQLWQRFMSKRGEIKNNLTTDLISLQIYPLGFDFNPTTQFEKWAAVEVSDFEHVPDEMESLSLSEGLYAVFEYKGSSTDTRIFQYIFRDWLAKSGYQLDNRPHFEVLGEKYKNASPDSEEEIWIPVKLK
jgi:AraC family transcriptional regulator